MAKSGRVMFDASSFAGASFDIFRSGGLIEIELEIRDACDGRVMLRSPGKRLLAALERLTARLCDMYENELDAIDRGNDNE